MQLQYGVKGLVFFYFPGKVTQATHSLLFEINGIFLFPAALFHAFGKNNGYFFISVLNLVFFAEISRYFLFSSEIYQF